MSCRLPGGIDSPEKLWEALLRGDDLVTEIPAERWDVDEYYDPERGVPGRSISRWGAFLDDIAGFDSDFFGVTERKAGAIDPQHRLLMETSWEAIEHAGMDPSSLAGSPTGVFVGLSHDDYTWVTRDAGAYGYTDTAYNMASGWIAYTLGVHGPAMTVDTACSSGLLAAHLACRSLQASESDLALAGGCLVLLEPCVSAWASAQRMLSPTGRCRAFDVAADGFVRSEGCAVLLLKRLPDALRDGDRILGVVRGTAANHDGRTPTISTPSFDAQVAASHAALSAAGVDADTVGVVEAHGTGTPVGDPIEFASLARIYGTAGNRCLLGSAKSNFGHTEAAAGALGLIKAILQLQHGVVPPMVHFTRLPDDLARIETGLVVPKVITPWPDGYEQTPRRAAVSSYGVSGTNVHAILEQAPDTAELDDVPDSSAMAGPSLFALSSTSADELGPTSRRLAEWVEDRADSVALSDLAYTLARRRAHRPVRTVVVAGSRQELTSRLREIAVDERPYQAAVGRDDRGPVWVFSGQGSQWPAMGADLLANEPVFAARVAEAEPLIAREAGFSVTEAMSASQTVTGIEQVQPTLFTMQVALAAAMLSYGVRPGAVIGHSLGEVAAAVVAGGLSLEDGVRVICRRSRLLSRIAGSGAMASVELPASQVLSEMATRGLTDIAVSVIASPESTVVGGATQTVRDLVTAWEQRDVMAREVAVDVASHSPQVDPILAELADALAELHPTTAAVPFYSATLDDPRSRPALDAGYWVDNLRHTVRFAAAVKAALEDGYRVFAELTPHPLLTRAVEQTANALDMPAQTLASLRREQSGSHVLRDFLADLHSAGAAVDFSALYPSGRLVDAPLATWTHRRLLVDKRGRNDQANGARIVVVHPLLGEHVLLPEEPARHAWQGDVGTAALPWLNDHRIRDVPAMPGAAFCEMAIAAARFVLGDGSQVRDVRFEEMLLLEDQTLLTAVATVEASGVVDFEVTTDHEGDRTRRARAVLHAADGELDSPKRDISALFAAHPHRVDGGDLRQWLDERGVGFGPAFTGLAAVHTADGKASTVLAEVRLPGPVRSQQRAYGIHPALLDACFQSVAAHPAVRDAGDGGMPLPLGVRLLQMYGPVRDAHYCYARVNRAEGPEFEADLDVLDESGTVLMAVHGLRMRTGVSESSDRDRVLAERLLTVDWQQGQLPCARDTNAGAWLLITTSGDDDLLTATLTEALHSHGADCRILHWPVHADHVINAEQLRSDLRSGVNGVVILTPPPLGDPDEESLLRGREQVRHLVRITRELLDLPGEPPRLHVVTRGAQTVLDDDRANLDQAGLRGLLRVIGAEHPQLRPTQIDVDEASGPEQVASELLSSSEEDETAWRGGRWYTARLCPSPLRPDERRTTIVNHGRDAMRLQIRTPGDLETMELAAFDRVPPGAGQIEVAVSTSSINFADVLVAMGRYPTVDGGQPELGMDFAGVVTAIGPGVTDHEVGDRVGGFSRGGCWGTFVTAAADLAVTLPPGLTAEAAAAMSTTYGTAWYGLHDLAGIGSGDRVLIHSATGGVGQAAIAIARRAGAEIFATAGSPQRRQLLRDMGVEHVYDSRTTEFAELIRRDSDGYGVDIVLNSLPGAAQRAGFELLSTDGRFVEIGKRDVYANNQLGLYPFRRNLTFYYVDLALMCDTRPRRVRDLVGTVYELVADGELPHPPTTHYPLAEAATAIRVMSAAEHSGKLVLDMPLGGQSSAVVPPQRAPVFRRDGAYVITGGLGGLGLFLAAGMAAAGCGRIVLTGRSQPNPKAEKAIARIRATGADIAVECGNIAEPETATRLVAAATATGLPVRGVLHAAAVVEDATLTNITDELIDRDWSPKVRGAWHLHHATAAQPLDWFCSFSSAAALLGSPGQGAYAAANSWLDAFTHWRRSQGLPANAIAWGAWEEIGRAAGLAGSGRTTMITPAQGAYAFHTLLRYDRAYTGYLPTVGTQWLTALVQRSPFAEALQAVGVQDATGTSTVRAELRSLSQDEWPVRLGHLVAEQVSVILRRSVDPDRPFSDHGLDSLGNLELRTRIETETGIRLSPKAIAAHNTARALARHLSDTLSAELAV